MAPPALGRRASCFFATQGPMKTTLASGCLALMALPSMTMGEGVPETISLSCG